MKTLTADRARNTLLKSHDAGFSLLEIVVAVSIMLILAVVGFVAYQNLTDNAREAAAENAANQVLTAVLAADDIHDGDTTAAVRDYNSTAEDIVVNISVANANEMTVKAEDANDTEAFVTVSGNYSHIDVTEFREPGVTYGWAEHEHLSASIKYLHGEEVARNVFPNPQFTMPAGSTVPSKAESHYGTGNTGEVISEDGKLTLNSSLESGQGRFGVRYIGIRGYDPGEDVVRVKLNAELSDGHRVGVYVDQYDTSGRHIRDTKEYITKDELDGEHTVEIATIPDTGHVAVYLWLDVPATRTAEPGPSTVTFWEPYLGPPSEDYFDGNSM